MAARLSGDRQVADLARQVGGSLAAPRIAGSFRQFCKKTGRSRSTAERRVAHELERVVLATLINTQSLQGPSWSRVMPMMPNQRIDLDKVATVTSWMAEGAKPTEGFGEAA